MSNHAVGTMGDRRVTLQRLDGFGWGLFFVWIGIALLANLSWGIGLLGVGILVLAGQMVRKYMAAGLETFWVLVGLFFITGGVWMLLGIRVSLIPIFSIAAGLAILISALFGKPTD